MIKKALSRILIALFGVILLLLIVGIIVFPRADLPTPVKEDFCAENNIRFDTTSLEKIYFDPEGILADPEAFLNEDPAYRMLAETRAKVAAPFQFESWLEDIEKLASKTEENRENQKSFKLYELIMAHQQSFCKEVGPHVLAYLPEGTDLGVNIYLTALDDPVPACAKGQDITFSLSHPLFAYAAVLHEPTALSSFFNLALHELFHIGFSDNFKPPSLEEHMENEVVIDMLIVLHNEGIATHIEHELSTQYPSPFEWFLYMIDQKPIVRWYFNRMNDLFAIAQTKPTGDAYKDIYRRIGSLGFDRKGFYIIGAYMAMTIEEELGREALIQTIVDGYESFADTFNSIAEEGMLIRWRPEP
ncbi:MAG: hypothetical protein JSV37_15235 [Anaerolineaceae bacterium]|nr:MAG: hypothetical protein JSV37_15235 [Anaerolineaceae bacterium]